MELRRVDRFKYLGRVLSYDDCDTPAIQRNLKRAWAVWERISTTNSIAEYIAARRQNILRTIADRPILEECRGAERRRGSPPRLYWWEQEVEEELSSEEEEEEEDWHAGRATWRTEAVCPGRGEGVIALS